MTAGGARVVARPRPLLHLILCRCGLALDAAQPSGRMNVDPTPKVGGLS
jgi:hypothetical protein